MFLNCNVFLFGVFVIRLPPISLLFSSDQFYVLIQRHDFRDCYLLLQVRGMAENKRRKSSKQLTNQLDRTSGLKVACSIQLCATSFLLKLNTRLLAYVFTAGDQQSKLLKSEESKVFTVLRQGFHSF